jgi:CRISPR-associated protein Cas2
LSATDLVRLRSRLYDIINLGEDQVLFVPMCAKCVNGIEAIGRPTEAVDAKDVVVVV